MRRRMLILLPLLALCMGTTARGQNLLDRTPNVSGGWVGGAGVVHFNFLHRFNNSGEPQRQITNRPTFLLAAGVAPRLLVGAHYATRSDVVARMPNEWEAFARYGVLDQTRHPLDLGLQVGYNASAESVDAELSAARRFDRLRLMAAARALSAGYGEDTRYAVAAGATLRITRSLGLAGDIGTLLDAADEEELAWGVGLQAMIPLTPHSFSIQATNTNSATLQGSSRGAGEVRWGFEFTVPVTLARYFRRGAAPASADTGQDTAPAAPDAARAAPDAARAAPDAAGRSQGGGARDSVVAGMKNLAYAPARIEIDAGTTVIWRNEDPLEHTVTARDGTWDSGMIAPGASWRRTFDQPGEYPFICTPHPFMTGVVVVRARQEDGP